MKPIELPPNLQRHFYAGGPRIAALRGLDIDAERMPEEWIGAVSSMFGQPERGLSRLADGTLVRDAVAADPEAYLGPEHVARYGADPGLLVKLLDAGQRLPVHFHPGRAFARRRSTASTARPRRGSSSRPTAARPCTSAGRAPSSPTQVREWIRTQDARGDARARCTRGAVAAGDAIFVPAGTPHAIGAGILLVELQEPTDFSILLEWEALPADRGAGPPRPRLGPCARGARLRPRATSWARATEPAPGGGGPVLPRRAPQRADAALDAGFSILVGLGGQRHAGHRRRRRAVRPRVGRARPVRGGRR